MLQLLIIPPHAAWCIELISGNDCEASHSMAFAGSWQAAAGSCTSDGQDLALRRPRMVVADCSRASLPWRIIWQNSEKSILPSLSASTSERILSISFAAVGPPICSPAGKSITSCLTHIWAAGSLHGLLISHDRSLLHLIFPFCLFLFMAFFCQRSIVQLFADLVSLQIKGCTDFTTANPKGTKLQERETRCPEWAYQQGSAPEWRMPCSRPVNICTAWGS